MDVIEFKKGGRGVDRLHRGILLHPPAFHKSVREKT